MAMPQEFEPIEDLVDFYNRWPKLRSVASQMSEFSDFSEHEKRILEWMIVVIDRVGPADLDHDKEKTDE